VNIKNAAWRTQSRDASTIRDVKISIANDLDKDAKEAQLLFGRYNADLFHFSPNTKPNA